MNGVDIIVITMHIFLIFTIYEFIGYSEIGARCEDEFTIGVNRSCPYVFIDGDLFIDVITCIGFIARKVNIGNYFISIEIVTVDFNLVSDFTLVGIESNAPTRGVGGNSKEWYQQQGKDNA